MERGGGRWGEGRGGVTSASSSLHFSPRGTGTEQEPRWTAEKNSTNLKMALAVQEYVLQKSSYREHLHEIADNDVNCVTAHCFQGLSILVQTSFSARSIQEARSCLETAEDLVDMGAGLPREKLYTFALRALLERKYHTAAMALENCVLLDIEDLLSLRLAFDIYQLIGDAKNMHSVVAKVVPMWDVGDQGYCEVASLYSLGQSAVGLAKEAHVNADRALDLYEDWPTAIHAKLHAFEAESAYGDAFSLVRAHKDDFEQYDLFHPHLLAHMAWSGVDSANIPVAKNFFGSQIMAHVEAVENQIAELNLHTEFSEERAASELQDILADGQVNMRTLKDASAILSLFHFYSTSFTGQERLIDMFPENAAMLWQSFAWQWEGHILCDWAGEASQELTPAALQAVTSSGLVWAVFSFENNHQHEQAEKLCKFLSGSNNLTVCVVHMAVMNIKI